MLVRLSNSGAIDLFDYKAGEVIPDFIDRRARFVYEGDFESADGPVKVTADHLTKLAQAYNSRWGKLKRLASGEVPIGANPPIQLDHTRSAQDTVGRLNGELSVDDFTDDDGKTKKALYGNLRFLGKENVEKVMDGRWHNLSIGADFDTAKLYEMTVTPFPAAENASMMKAKDDSKPKDKKPMFILMKKRAEKYFKLTKKMSDEDTEKELKRLEEAEDEEELKKLAKEMDDEDEKKDKDKKEKDEKLAAGRGSITQLSNDFRTTLNGAQLKARTASLYQRLSGLRASGKITPAEIKKLNVKDLAGKPDDTVTSVLKSYEDRQPVIMVGQIGSMRTLTHEEIMAKYKRVEYKGQPITELQARSLMNHGRMSKDDYKKLEAKFAAMNGDETGDDDVVNIHVDTDPHADYAAMESEYGEICSLIDGGNGAAAKEALKKLMERFKSRGGYGMSEPAMHENSGNELAALQTDIVELTKKFDEAIGLAQSLAAAGV